MMEIKSPAEAGLVSEFGCVSGLTLEVDPLSPKPLCAYLVLGPDPTFDAPQGSPDLDALSRVEPPRFVPHQLSPNLHDAGLCAIDGRNIGVEVVKAALGANRLFKPFLDGARQRVLDRL